MTPIDIPWANLPHHHCFGCSPKNPAGLQLHFSWHGSGGLSTTFRLGRAHESYPGIVHGGLVGAICDETMGNLILLRTDTAPVTTSMRLRYIAPLAIDVDYTCVATLQADDGNGFVRTAAEVLDSSSEVMAAASATYRLTGTEVALTYARISGTDTENPVQARTGHLRNGEVDAPNA